jgi:methylmalonyl-CoA mutase
MTMAELSLARDFPSADAADWQALVQEALKGEPFASLRSRSYDGIVIEPLYARAKDGRVVSGRAPGEPWTVMQRIDLPDAAEANAQVLDDLYNGASGLVLVFAGATGDYGYALEPTEAAIVRALQGVQLDAGIAVELDLSRRSKDAAGMLARHIKASGLAPGAVNIRFGFDPLGAIATTGQSPKSWSDIAANFARLIADLAGQGFSGPFAVADARPVHAAGGSEAQELAFALANAVAYLKAMEAGGAKLQDARASIFFRLAADQDQFLTIAKFRALRKLWARVEEACGLDAQPAFVAAETAWRMMTKRDPHGNIVRATIAALGAALGGADAVTVLPYTAALGAPAEHARRIARNTQTILIEEANLHRVADPATGSGAIEALTSELCAAAWKLFQEIEGAGGAAEALNAGLIQQKVAKVRTAREANVARRKETMVGTSDFPDLNEESVPVKAAPRPSVIARAAGREIEALPRYRLAEPFERLRDESDTHLACTGERPKVFLAPLGRPADFTARASFAKNLFETGGIEAVTSNGAGSRDDMLKAFKASGAALACLCSSDSVYANEAADAAKALAAAGAKHIYLAGKPGDNRPALEEAGVETFLYQGCYAVEVLKAAHDIGRDDK